MTALHSWLALKKIQLCKTLLLCILSIFHFGSIFPQPAPFSFTSDTSSALRKHQSSSKTAAKSVITLTMLMNARNFYLSIASKVLSDLLVEHSSLNIKTFCVRSSGRHARNFHSTVSKLLRHVVPTCTVKSPNALANT